MEKKELRRQVRESNKEKLTLGYRRGASAAICNKLKLLPQFRQATQIGLYHALPDEPDLAALLAEFSLEKALFLPRVNGEDIAFYPYLGEATLDAGSFGIAEPSPTHHSAIAPSALELIVVPGMAFSKEGVRLGRGKAFYDRFLPQTSAFLVGVTFDYRLLPHIPRDQWDYPMHIVITD